MEFIIFVLLFVLFELLGKKSKNVTFYIGSNILKILKGKKFNKEYLINHKNKAQTIGYSVLISFLFGISFFLSIIIW